MGNNGKRKWERHPKKYMGNGKQETIKNQMGNLIGILSQLKETCQKLSKKYQETSFSL